MQDRGGAACTRWEVGGRLSQATPENVRMRSGRADLPRPCLYSCSPPPAPSRARNRHGTTLLPAVPADQHSPLLCAKAPLLGGSRCPVMPAVPSWQLSLAFRSPLLFTKDSGS